jgi:hypothetical protein
MAARCPKTRTHLGTATRRGSGNAILLSSKPSAFGMESGWDKRGSPMTDAAKITERIRRVKYGNMEILITVDDLKAYTRHWTVKLNHFIVLNTGLLDYICLETKKTFRT